MTKIGPPFNAYHINVATRTVTILGSIDLVDEGSCGEERARTQFVDGDTCIAEAAKIRKLRNLDISQRMFMTRAKCASSVGPLLSASNITPLGQQGRKAESLGGPGILRSCV